MEERFHGELWGQIVESLAHVFGFGEEEKERFRSAKVPRLIAAIPFVAGCSQAMRTALSHLGTYIIATRSPAFNHDPSDGADPYSRFRPIMNFQGGDRDLMICGLGRLALVSFADHLRDLEEDRKVGKYNPIATGEWTDSTRRVFESDAHRTASALYDAILPPHDSINSFWEW